MNIEDPSAPRHVRARPDEVTPRVVTAAGTWGTIGAILGVAIDAILDHPEVWNPADSNVTANILFKILPPVLAVLAGLLGARQGSAEARKHVTPTRDPAVWNADLGRLESLVPYSEVNAAVERVQKHQVGADPPIAGRTGRVDRPPRQRGRSDEL